MESGLCCNIIAFSFLHDMIIISLAFSYVICFCFLLASFPRSGKNRIFFLIKSLLIYCLVGNLHIMVDMF